MKYAKILALFLVLGLTLGTVASYEFEGDANPTTACTDDTDNDGDGDIDGKDSGCVEPYYLDDSESMVYDTDMSWVFSQGDTGLMQTNGPSIFEGGKVVRETNDAEWGDVGVDSTTLREFYVDSPGGEDNWGAGAKASVTASYSGAEVDSSSTELLDPPHDQGNDCGDGKDDGETREECPQDQGLPVTDSGIGVTGGDSPIGIDWDGDLADNRGSTSDEGDTGGSFAPDYIPNTVWSGGTSITSSLLKNSKVSTSTGDYVVLNTEEYYEQVGSITGYEKTGTSTVYTVTYGTVQMCGKNASEGGCTYTDCEPSGSVTAYDTKELSEEFSTTTIDSYSASYDSSSGSYTISANIGSSSDTGYFDSYEDAESTTYYTDAGCGQETVYEGQNYYDDSSTSYSKVTGDDRTQNTRYYYNQKVRILQNKKNVNTGFSSQVESEVTNGESVRDTTGGYRAGGGTKNKIMYNSQSEAYTYFDAVHSGAVSKYSGSQLIMKPVTDSEIIRDASGPDGQGSGFIAIEEGQGIVGATEGFLEKEIQNGAQTNLVGPGSISVPSCPGDYTKCMAAVTPYITSDSAGTIEFDISPTYSTGASLGVCKTYKRLSNDDALTCGFEIGDLEGGNGGGGDDDPPIRDGTCGDEPNEYWAYMEGYEVDDATLDNNPGAQQACISDPSQCVIDGQVVEEGHVENVASKLTAGFEKGEDRPDREVCLDIPGEGDTHNGDNEDWDNDGTPSDIGGEWYDLDSEVAQNYLRNSGNSLITGGNSGDSNDIAYYWNSQVNPPQDPTYNPDGDQAGTAMEDDCGNPRFDSLRCDDQGATTDRGHGSDNQFFSFFQEGFRDDDYHPTGQDASAGNFQKLKGTVNRLQEQSNQLEASMDTDSYDGTSYTIWEDTRGGQYADSWAVTRYENWSIDSTGTPYPPFSAWYRDPNDARTSTADGSRGKKLKAFGNSYSAVASSSFSYTNEDGQTIQVEQGDGVWIDPDMIKTASNYILEPDAGGWRDALSRTDPYTGIDTGFKLDLTGNDAGLGIDVSSNFECLSARSNGGCKVVAEDIYWKQSDSGTLNSDLERPVCGDDRNEYLIEQVGEDSSSRQFSGPYACSNSLATCYDSDASQGNKLVEQGGYRDVNEPQEGEGRLKDDREICQKKDPQDDFAVWYDQDYQEDYCNENFRYGRDGIRWFDESYVTTYPKAVQGGIDDSWSEYLEQQGHESFDSQPGNTGSGITPVPTGDDFSVTATRGFCGGDDDSEYLVTQECNTRYCETDRSIQGVAKVPGSCVMRADNSLYETDVSERKIFKPGESVEITNVDGNPNIACFNGAWFSNWPVSFNQEEVEVPKGSTRTVSFEIVNIRDTETTFEVFMEQSGDSPSADQFSEFVSKEGNSFTTTVKPTSSKTFRVEITGGNENLDFSDPGSDLTIRADGVNSGLVGSDSVKVDILAQSADQIGRPSQTENVPGIKTLQVIVLMLVSTMMFFTSRRS